MPPATECSVTRSVCAYSQTLWHPNPSRRMALYRGIRAKHHLRGEGWSVQEIEIHFPWYKIWLKIWLVHENELYLQLKCSNNDFCNYGKER